MSPRLPFSQVLPAALLYIWPRGRLGGSWFEAADRLIAALGPNAGVVGLDEGLIGVVPVADDPAVVDTAVGYGALLLAEAADLGAGEAGLLVAPGQVSFLDGETGLVADPLDADLRRQPPQLAPGRVHLTSRAAYTLEERFELVPAGEYVGPSGRSARLVARGRRPLLDRPWRNPELLGRPTRPVARPGVASALAAALSGPVTRVTGPLGCGKSRAVADAVAALGGTLLTVRAPADRSAGATLELQLVTRWLAAAGGGERAEEEGQARAVAAARRRRFGREAVGETDRGEAALIGSLLPRAAARLAASGAGPLVVVCDDLEKASADDFAVLDRLIAAADPGSLRLVLVGRSEVEWPAGWERLPRVEVPEFAADEFSALADALLTPLAVPPPVCERFVAAAAGHPFCLEEGLAGLIHARSVRASWGNFFFSGDDGTRLPTSPRLTQHVAAEAARLGADGPLTLLALADEPMPASEIGSALSLLGGGAEHGWEAAAARAGWIARRDGPWGEGVGFRVPGIAQALAATLPASAIAEGRRALGELLGELATGPAGRWRAYRLLAGSPQAAALLLRLATAEGEPADGGPTPAELSAALQDELAQSRRRGAPAAEELGLLLAWLPHALRGGVTPGLEAEVAAAERLAAQLDSAPQLLAARRARAELERRRGQLAQAEAALRGALATAGRVGIEAKGGALLDLAALLVQAQRFDEAERLLDGLLASVPEGGPIAATCSFHLGNLALRQGRFGPAYTLHRQALAGRRGGGEPRTLVASLTAVGSACLGLGRYSEALASFAEAEERARAAGDESDLAFSLLGLGRTRSRLGDFAGAAGALRQALQLRERKGDALGQALAHLVVAENFLDLDQPREALRAAREAHFRLSLVGREAPQGQAELLLGRILLARRRFLAARSHLLRAHDLAREQGDRATAAFAVAWMIEEATGSGRAEAVLIHTDTLARALQAEPSPEMAERLEYHLYRGLAWLRAQGVDTPDEPQAPLGRAYARLLAKVGHLEPELRQRFLFQVPENRAIVDEATRQQVAG